MRHEPYKVIAWAPGYLGSGVIKELLKRPEFELVGVLAYSDHKNGMDVGEMLGIGPVGVKMTTDQEEIMAMDPVDTGDVQLLAARLSKEQARILREAAG